MYAEWVGTAPTGHVLLVAHHDSVPQGPGASDDASNVAAILEIVRALKAGPAPRDTIQVLFTDGEEEGPYGAAAYVETHHPTHPEHTVVINLEARETTTGLDVRDRWCLGRVDARGRRRRRAGLVVDGGRLPDDGQRTPI